MDFLEFAKQRYSVRSFKSEHLKQEEIDKIINAGMVAPTGCNNQPQRILVLNKDESLEKLKKCTKCHFNAPCAMLVCYNRDESWKRPADGALSAVCDASIVTTHMMLEAYSLGIGSTWVMYFEPFEMREEFNIPENFEISALLVMGYPADDAKPLNLHFESKTADDVVFYDSF